MALRAGYKGIKKYVADMLNKMNPGDTFATDAEIAAAAEGVTDLMEDTVGWISEEKAKLYTYSQTANGVTFTYNPMSVKLDGTALGNDALPSSANVPSNGKITLEAGTYKLSTDNENIKWEVIGLNPTTSLGRGSNFTFSLSSQKEVFVRVYMSIGDVYSNTTGFFTLRKISVEDILATKADISALGTQEGATASRLYHPGEHFYKDGKFCTVIGSSDVAADSTWTLNTNYVEGAVGDYINHSLGRISITVGTGVTSQITIPVISGYVPFVVTPLIQGTYTSRARISITMKGNSEVPEYINYSNTDTETRTWDVSAKIIYIKS